MVQRMRLRRIADLVVSRDTMLTLATKRGIIIGLPAALFASAIAFFLCTGHRTRILDTRFHVVSVTASRGTNQTIYFDNQLVGRVRQQLANLGLGIKPVQKGTFSGLGTNMWVVVTYNGTLTKQELEGIEAELVNNAGKVFRIRQFIHALDPATTNCVGAWLIESRYIQMTNRQSYDLRLKLPNHGGPLAEIQLGVLKP